MVSLCLEQETILPREVRKLRKDLLLNRQLHGKYLAATEGFVMGLAVLSCHRHL